MEIGTRLGPYEIVEPLGAGGMGEVYRARDTKLGREVAIKVLPEAVSQDSEKLARFGREAHLLASVNHPNIATLYGLEESNGQQFLVMELVEGETLAERLARGPMPVEEALPLFQQIAEGLETAHEKGIIHRDLKPSNIKITPEGVPKILDFGLAKALVEEGSVQDNSQSPTLTRDATGTGVLLGTAAYMSPEQARGKPVDKRTDIFSFGIVLYEALSGQRAFPGDDVSDVLASIIKLEPDWEALPSGLDPRLQNLVRRCLRKDRRKRLQAMGDVRVEIEDVLSQPLAVSAPSRTRERAVWTFVALLLAGITGITVWSFTDVEPPPQSVTRFPLTLPLRQGSGQRFSDTSRTLVAISPDGARVVYVANGQLYLREIDKMEAVPIRGADNDPSNPFFSPDGHSIGFFASMNLRKVAVTGGTPVTVCEARNPLGASWGADDTIIFGQFPAGILRVSANGGTPEVLIPGNPDKGEVMHRPQMLPDGQTLLFTLATTLSWDEAQIVTQSLETGERRVIIEKGADARYLSTGYLVYALDETLLAVPFDAERLKVTGGVVPVVEGVARADPPWTGAAHLSVSDSGSLVYVPSGVEAKRKLVWVERDGTEETLLTSPGAYVYPRISPDGSRLALDRRDEDRDIWIWDFARETLSRLTFDPGDDYYPTWTPDGRRIAFGSLRDGPPNLYWKAADGSAAVERLTEGEKQVFPYAFSTDGKRLLCRTSSGTGTHDLGILSLGDDVPSLEPLLATEFNERNAEMSPDGRWIAYESDASGQFEIYVRPFPNVEEAKWQISTSGGREPLWARNGRELFYLDLDRRLMSASVRTNPTLEFGTPVVIFEKPFPEFPNAVGRTYDVSPDGKRFLMIRATGEGGTETIHVVLNWFEELKRLVPTE